MSDQPDRVLHAESPRPRVGLIGLGAMGRPIGMNLVDSGYPLAVHDESRAAASPLIARGATWHASPSAVAAASDFVLTSLPGPTEVRGVAVGRRGILNGFSPGGVWIDLSTNSPRLIKELHGLFLDRGCFVVDAPIGGRSPLIRARKVQLMVGGEEAVVSTCMPILKTIGERVIRCGGPGSGMTVKLIHNAINAVFRQVAAECFTAGVKAGVTAEVLWEAVRTGITCGGSEIGSTLPSTWLVGQFDSGTGSLANHYKDTELAVQIGEDHDVPMEHVSLTLNRLAEAVRRGWGDRDAPVSLLVQEESAGVAVRFVRPQADTQVGLDPVRQDDL